MYELELMTGPAIRQLIDRGATTVIVPFGSVEYQDAHLPIGADAVLADLVGREVASRLDAVLAPTMRVGSAQQHMYLPGTLTLRPETLRESALDIAESLAEHGFRLVAFTSTHGGNAAPLRAAAEHFNRQRRQARACVPEGDVGEHPGSHSGQWLTSVMLAVRPELVEIEGVTGGLREELQRASAEAGAIYFERFVSAMVTAVREAADAPE
jgi:creatinine amidohydrolase